MIEIWPYFLAELLRYGGGVPTALGINIAAAGMVAGLRAVFKGDPFENLQKKALKALEPAIPDRQQRKALWRSIGEVFHDSELVSRRDWCAVLVENGVAEAFAGELYDRMAREFSALVARAAGRDPAVFIQSAHRKLEELQAGQQQILTFVSQIETVIGQGRATGARLDDIIRALAELKELARAMSVPPPLAFIHQLPAPPGDFTGREQELGELRSALTTGGVTISGVTGMGGVGKTVLALKLADELKDRYPDAQFYLDLLGTSDQPMTPAAAMTYVIHGFHPEANLPESEAELRALYCSVLDGKRVLLLMDNAADANQVRPLIPPPSCMLLVTSRQHFTLPGLHPKNLDVLPPEDSCELLRVIAGRPIGGEADEIARLCGYLPLALRAAGSLLAVTPNLDPAEYARELSDARQRLARIGQEGVDVGIEASFGLSYQRLPDDTAGVFRKLAVFPGSLDAAAEEVVCEDAEHRRLSELVRRSLVQWDDTSKRYRLHDLVRLFAESRLAEDERQAAQQRHGEHYRAVLAAADDLYLEGGDGVLRGLELYDMEQPNIQAGHASAMKGAADDQEAARLSSDYAGVGPEVLALRLPPLERIAWLDAALTAARMFGDRKAEGVHLSNLGLAYAALGQTRKAIRLQQDRLEIARELGDRRAEANALGNLGNCYADLRETGEAIEYHQRDLRIRREIGDRRGEGGTLGNLGRAYADLGETSKAIEFHRQHLAIAREIGDRRGEGHALGSLGLGHAALGETRKATGFFREALAVHREIGDRRGEANDLWNMSLALNRLRRRGQAISNAEAALVIFEEIDDPDVEKVRRQLAEWRKAK
jgi:tetratricopeptide (TPR) repeat protein